MCVFLTERKIVRALASGIRSFASWSVLYVRLYLYASRPLRFALSDHTKAMIQLLYVNNIPLSSVNISCSCNFHDTISQQLHCRFRPYVSRKAATPSQSASHNPLIPIREMLGANKTTCPLPQCGTSKCHQTPIFKSNPSPVRAGRIQRVPCFQSQAFYIWARFWLQFLGIYNFF